MPAMLITTGQIQNGAIEIDDQILPEGAKVTILVHEDDETFEVSAADEARLLEAIAEAERGDDFSASEVLRELQ
jgi:hypothetical protein